jgi:hypothetical protein
VVKSRPKPTQEVRWGRTVEKEQQVPTLAELLVTLGIIASLTGAVVGLGAGTQGAAVHQQSRVIDRLSVQLRGLDQ